MAEHEEISVEFIEEDLATRPQYQKFNLYRNNKRIKRPTCVKEGEVKFYNNFTTVTEIGLAEANRPYVCIKNRNKYVWRELSEISGAKFNSNKEEIEKLWSGNLLRVLEEVEAIAKSLQEKTRA